MNSVDIKDWSMTSWYRLILQFQDPGNLSMMFVSICTWKKKDCDCC